MFTATVTFNSFHLISEGQIEVIFKGADSCSNGAYVPFALEVEVPSFLK